MIPTEHAQELITQHPDLAGQVQAGLILALAGRVEARSEQMGFIHPQGGQAGTVFPLTIWVVKGDTYEGMLCQAYVVSDLPTTPRRWSCTCEQGQNYGPTTGDFSGLAGRICKHIAAVAVCVRTGEYPAPPASVWDLFCRLIKAGGLDYLGREEETGLPGPHGLRVIRPTGETMILAKGRIKSEALAIRTRTGWTIPEWGRGHYDSWVERIKG
jgi:hypothetical protein